MKEGVGGGVEGEAAFTAAVLYGYYRARRYPTAKPIMTNAGSLLSAPRLTVQRTVLGAPANNAYRLLPPLC